MSKNPRARKLRRFFTNQSLQNRLQDLWLEPSETHHLRDSIRLKIHDACLITDGEGREVEAFIQEFSTDGRTHLRIHRITKTISSASNSVLLRVMPALLRKGKTDFLVEKAQELGVGELQPIFSEYCEVKIAKEKIEKIVERWNRIAREAGKQSGALKVLHISEPIHFKEAVSAISLEELLVVFHPCPEAISFKQWLAELRDLKGKIKALNILIGPEGGFSEDELSWVRWKRSEKQYRIVSLGDVLLKADTAFVGIVSSLNFSGVLAP